MHDFHDVTSGLVGGQGEQVDGLANRASRLYFNLTGRRVLVLMAIAVTLGILMSTTPATEPSKATEPGQAIAPKISKKLVELYRKSLKKGQDIVVVAGPCHAPSSLGGSFKNGQFPGFGGCFAEVRVEMRTEESSVLLWSYLVGGASCDPETAVPFFVRELIVKDDYFLMVTSDIGGDIEVFKVYPFGIRTPITVDLNRPEHQGGVAVQSRTITRGDYFFSGLLPLENAKRSDVGVEVQELPGDRYALTIKDMTQPEEELKKSGMEYPVFEQRSSRFLDFHLKNVGFKWSRRQRELRQ